MLVHVYISYHINFHRTVVARDVETDICGQLKMKDDISADEIGGSTSSDEARGAATDDL